MDIPGAERPPRSSGLFSGVSDLLNHVSALFKNRLDLAALELTEIRAGLLKALAISMSVVLVAWFALAFWSALLVFFAWPVLGWKILLILAALFSCAGLAGFFWVRGLLGRMEFLPTTKAELRKDLDVLIR